MNTKIGFRILRNVRFDIGDGVTYMPKVSFIEKFIPHLHPKTAHIPVFDVGDGSAIHYAHLRSEVPELPPDIGNLDEDLASAIRDDAVKVALENRKRNAEIRRLIAAYVSDGTIQLVDEKVDDKTNVNESESTKDAIPSI